MLQKGHRKRYSRKFCSTLDGVPIGSKTCDQGHTTEGNVTRGHMTKGHTTSCQGLPSATHHPVTGACLQVQHQRGF